MDRQTDGQTDRILIAIPRLHYMQRGNEAAIKQTSVLLLADAVQ